MRPQIKGCTSREPRDGILVMLSIVWRRGGTGRRAGFKIRWPSGLVGSTPTVAAIDRFYGEDARWDAKVAVNHLSTTWQVRFLPSPPSTAALRSPVTLERPSEGWRRSPLGKRVAPSRGRAGSIPVLSAICTDVAQLVEHRIPNPTVVGSSPSVRAIWRSSQIGKGNGFRDRDSVTQLRHSAPFQGPSRHQLTSIAGSSPASSTLTGSLSAGPKDSTHERDAVGTATGQ